MTGTRGRDTNKGRSVTAGRPQLFADLSQVADVSPANPLKFFWRAAKCRPLTSLGAGVRGRPASGPRNYSALQVFTLVFETPRKRASAGDLVAGSSRGADTGTNSSHSAAIDMVGVIAGLTLGGTRLLLKGRGSCRGGGLHDQSGGRVRGGCGRG